MLIANKYEPSITMETDKYTSARVTEDTVNVFQSTPMIAGVLSHIRRKYGAVDGVEVSGVTVSVYGAANTGYPVSYYLHARYVSYSKRQKVIRYTVLADYKRGRVEWDYDGKEYSENIALTPYTAPDQVAERMDYVTAGDSILEKLKKYIKQDVKKQVAEENRKNAAAIDNMELFDELKQIAAGYGFDWSAEQDRYTKVKMTYGKYSIDMECTDTGIKVERSWKWPAGMAECVVGAVGMGNRQLPKIPYCDGEKAKALLRLLCAYIRRADYVAWDEYGDAVAKFK